MNNNIIILQRFKDYITNEHLVEKNDSIILSMSAGKDSMIMLDLFLKIKDKYNLKLHIFHLNHLMRGEESNKDQKLVNEIATKNKIKIFNYEQDFTKSNNEGSFEELARNKRYELLINIIKENKIKKIATAHTSNDNFETQLMRIFTGTSIWGLQGILPIRDNIIHPILFLTSNEIYKYLENNKIKWREDLSNTDSKYTRNYVRNKIIPVINERFQNSQKKMELLSANARHNNKLLFDLAYDIMNPYIEYTKENISITIFEKLYNKEFFLYILSDIIRSKFAIYVNTSMLEEIYKNFLSKKTNLILYKGKDFNIIKRRVDKNDKIIISSSLNDNTNLTDWNYVVKFNFKNEYKLEIDKLKIIFKWTKIDFFDKNKEKQNILFLDVSNNDEIIIRNRRNGDRLFFDKNKSKKIKDYCIDNKCSPEDKKRLPIFVLDNVIAAAAFGFINKGNNRVSKNFMITNKSKKILAIYCKEKI